MSKKVNRSGEQNFLIGLSKQSNGSNGFMPSGRHNHKKFWYVVIGIIVVIILFILGENVYSSHQSNSQPVHHTRTTKVTNDKSIRKGKKSHQKTNAQKIRERARRRAKRAKRLVRKREAEGRRISHEDQNRNTPQRRLRARQSTRTALTPRNTTTIQNNNRVTKR